MEIINKQIVDFFSDLKFNEEKHEYKVKNKKFTSVSNVKSRFQEAVDFDKIAEFIAKRDNCSKEEILNSWEEHKNKACELGTKVHNFAEFYRMGDIPELPQEKSFVKFFNSIPPYLRIAFKELQMYCPELGIAGTADLILYNEKTGYYKILDYKTNADLYKNYRGKKLLKPFEFLLDNPLSLYFLQLSLYKYLFQRSGQKVESMHIIWLKEDENFQRIDVLDYSDLIIKTLKNN